MAQVAFVLEDDYEDSEFQVPWDRLSEAGHTTTLIGTERGRRLTGKRGDSTAEVELPAGEASVEDFDALVIPGGYSPDKLRLNGAAVDFAREFVESGKPVAAICHAGQLLIEAGVVEGRRLTSWPSIKVDLVNAGAEWIDRQVVEDGNLITSRKPDDLDAFTKTLLGRL